jgi:hypothetical protein
LVYLRVQVYGICLHGHVTRRSRPTVPSGPLLLTTSSSSEQKRLVKRAKNKKDVSIWDIKKKCRHLRDKTKMKISEKIMTKKKEKNVSRSKDPSQGLERTAEIIEPGVRFPVEVRMCFNVKMWLRWFK